MKRRPLLAAIGASSLVASGVVPATAGTSATLALADGWVSNSESTPSLRGRIVVLDVFTFECVDCTRVLPGLRALYDGYA